MVALGWNEIGRWLSSDGALIVYGALLAGAIGWGTSWLQQVRETGARRDALLHLLSKQLWTLPSKPSDFDATRLLTRPNLAVSAVDPLLNTPLLDARKHAKLITARTIWQERQATMNALTFITNQAMVTGTLPSLQQRAWHEFLNELYGVLIALRDDITAGLPAKFQPPAWRPGDDRAETEGVMLEHRI
jgi:hypothetical protein